MSDTAPQDGIEERDIAIIGMAGRFPGSRDLQAFWQNLKDGREGVRVFSDEELAAAGVPAETLADPRYIKAGAILDDVDVFDAAFFGYTPREAELMDPQQRLFLQLAWSALEHASCVPERYDGVIGVFAGVAWNTYLLSNLTSHPELFADGGAFQVFITNDKDFMPTRTSYKLNLKGPSVIVQTSCSTSLVAVHLACQSLIDYDCDVALAGGVTIKVPQAAGYYYQDDGIASPDGHCRSFDAQAGGTVFGSGMGMVVLKRLQDALDDGDYIHAVIKGSAVNNDGALKVSYTAPSVEGQAAVVTAAQAVAQVEAETIGYIEAHGTATALGDPIEVAALTKAFRLSTDKTQFCAIGSVKSNLGHLDAAAGVAGLLKTVLALQHRQIPPSLHYETPNPKIDFTSSPFFVNTSLRHWPTLHAPRRAGVSSFGVGGTNAHVIVQEAPPYQPTPSVRQWHVLALSAKTATALDQSTAHLADYLRQHPDLDLADVAYTLQHGRAVFGQRRIVVCQDRDEAIAALESLNARRVSSQIDPQEYQNRPVAFLFPGQGAQYVGMGRDLYASEPVFRAVLDRCCTLLHPALGLDLRAVLYPAPDDAETASAQLTQTALAQPALFVVSYALAQLWQHWGVTPSALLGHSVGELVAATLAGVFTLDDALALVATRGRLMQRMPAGAMLAVAFPAAALEPLLGPDLALAAVNGPTQCVVSGPSTAVAALADVLTARGVQHRPLHTSHAFHSPMMEPVVAALGSALQHVHLRPPTLPFISNVSGTWITAAQATDPAYWTQQLRQPVLFAAGLDTLLDQASDLVLLEVGPGATLSTLARKHTARPVVLASTRHPHEQESDAAIALATLGRLWLAGVPIAWGALYAEERRQRIPLPSYAFDQQRYWIAPRAQTATIEASTPSGKQPDLADWFYLPSWQRSQRTTVAASSLEAQRWLIFSDHSDVGAAMIGRLRTAGAEVIVVQPGPAFSQIDDRLYSCDPSSSADYRALLDALAAGQLLPSRIIHCWSVTPAASKTDETSFTTVQEQGFYSLLFLAQALAQHDLPDHVLLTVISSQLHSIAGEQTIAPAKATLLAACKVIPQEYPQITCRSIDLIVPPEQAHSSDRQHNRWTELLLAECEADDGPPLIAYRDGVRWSQQFVPTRLEPTERATLRAQGVYVITGGQAGIGLALAEGIGKVTQGTLVLIDQPGYPDRAEWTAWMAMHDQHDRTSRMIQRVQALESQGATVHLIGADVSDEAQMRAALSDVQQRYGAIHGVIHAASVPEEHIFQPLAETDQAECAAQFAAKVSGLLVLERVLTDLDLDFCVLASSLAAVLGGRGYAAYAAANLFMDAFAHSHNRRQAQPWLSINWDAWRLADEGAQVSAISANLAQLALTPEEGMEAFQRMLAHDSTDQVVVSTAPLAARISQWLGGATHERDGSGASAAAKALHPRPTLPSSYVAPRSEQERALAGLWQRALGFEQVGIDDNFFELGGDSFIAIQVVALLKKELDIDLPAVKLYQALTIRALAELIDQSDEIAAQRRVQLDERKEQMGRRKQYQQMRRSRS